MARTAGGRWSATLSAVEIGVALPQMTTDLDREHLLRWCRGIDNGPFSSVSAGERITFHNLEGMSLCAAMAALTERVRVFVNVAVAVWHPPALLAKQLSTIDVLSGGRLSVAFGVGGRAEDFVALGVPTANRHQRLDDAVAEVRRLWDGGPAADGEPVGPPLVQDHVPVLASAMGPRGLARAARWADGISGFSLAATPAELQASATAARDAWSAAAREGPPRLVTGGFAALGHDSGPRLSAFASRYLRVFGKELADALAAGMTLHHADALMAVFDAAAGAGYDEFIVVPAVADGAMLDELAEVVARWRAA